MLEDLRFGNRQQVSPGAKEPPVEGATVVFGPEGVIGRHDRGKVTANPRWSQVGRCSQVGIGQIGSQQLSWLKCLDMTLART